jgi:hypothetical protein
MLRFSSRLIEGASYTLIMSCPRRARYMPAVKRTVERSYQNALNVIIQSILILRKRRRGMTTGGGREEEEIIE